MNDQPATHTGSSDGLATLIGTHDRNGPLTREFYTSASIFAAETERIFARQWLFAGHSCAIPHPGDWFTHEIGWDSIIVVRDAEGSINAFHNTCRHRGSRVCATPAGHGLRLVCPYHHWTYGLDGRLVQKTEAEYGVAPSSLSLHRVHIRDAAGLLFFSLAEDPPDFDNAHEAISRRLKPHGLARAKIATSIDYSVAANWKIIFENNRECFHCPTAHKEYTRATYDVWRTDPNRQAEVAKRTAECNARFRSLGLDEGDVSSDMTGAFYRAHRTPLMKGFVTQSLDGKPVAPLMGDLKERDAGTLRITVFPNFWQHASDDHAVSTRLTPVGPRETAVRVNWLVDKDAVEGKDYELDRLLPFWQRTSEQDWALCENNQAGVNSRRYHPGPFSRSKERNVAHFIAWYLNQLDGPGHKAT
ncbi:MAG: aromatic ring-hydroxylating oxygenase subunit alpha [Pseudomonadota bacterium]